jgi:lipoprotein signal peptidase
MMNLLAQTTLLLQGRPINNEFPSITIITALFIIAAFFMWFFIHRSKEKERLLLIEKGFSPSELPEIKNFGFSFSFPWLKVGCVITLGSIGMFLGIILMEKETFSLNGIEPLIGMLIFGGIGMIFAHFIDKPNNNS